MDYNVDADTFWEEEVDTEENFGIGCSAGWCRYFKNSGLSAMAGDTWMV